MIQMLTYTGTEKDFQGKGVVLSRIHDAKSLDDFDINIICLNDNSIWFYKSDAKGSINSIKDLQSLSLMIQGSKKAKNIIILPQNTNYHYDYYNRIYHKHDELKNMLPNFLIIMSELYSPIKGVNLVYENTRTNIKNEYIESSFYFYGTKDILLESERSKKPTAIELHGIILSTLNLKNHEQIINFLREINLIHDKQEIPDWMGEIKMFDDIQQFKVIEENNKTIKMANDNIASAMEKINKNSEYKSILYTNGEELVQVVFEILERMLGCDLSQFEDKKNEDFLFEKGGCVFIGEIKGVNHNVKSENVSQLDVHYQGYLEENEEKDQNSVKAILIMNHQKNKALNIREPVHEKQVNLAKRNGSLIVETITLLNLFEKYLAGSISQEKCLELLKTNVGLLKI